VTVDHPETPHTLRSIQEMLGLSRSAIAGLIANGFVQPARGPRNAYRFSFRDVVLLRTAHDLQAADIPTRKILRALQRLKATLPEELPLTGLRITAVGSSIAVRDRESQWEAETGQLLMDFDIAAARGAVAFVDRRRNEEAPSANAGSAETLFAEGEELESTDMKAAETAYHRALVLAPDHGDAYLNLGAILCESGRAAEAVVLYDEAVRRLPDVPLLHFNRAVALEDVGRMAEALDAYEHCLRLDATIADAHFNAARLHDHLGHRREAIRHFSAYRRLQK
jgi:tetratricopeptide (TPR) repeat protein